LTLAACQRRESVDVRAPLFLGSEEEWSFSTHPELSLSPEQLRSLTARLFESTGRFLIVSSATASDAARCNVRILSVDSQAVPDAAPEQATVQVRVRLEYLQHTGEDLNPLLATATATSRGVRDQAGAAATETALARAVQQISFELQASSKTDDELVADLHSPESFRSAAALEHLAARRHPAAFAPLIKQLQQDDAEVSLRALSALVSYDDPRAVRSIVDEAERRDFPFFIEALYALGSIGGEDAEAYLFTVQSGHADPRAQATATEALNLVHRRAAIGKRARAEPTAAGTKR
jgi:hypothetical protein